MPNVSGTSGLFGDLRKHQEHKLVAWGKRRWLSGVSLGLKRDHTSGTDNAYPDGCGSYY